MIRFLNREEENSDSQCAAQLIYFHFPSVLDMSPPRVFMEVKGQGIETLEATAVVIPTRSRGMRERTQTGEWFPSRRVMENIGAELSS